MSVVDELIESRIREINDAILILRDILAKEFGKLTIYEKLSMRYLVIQLVEASASICLRILLSFYNETAEGFPHCFERLGSRGVLMEELASRLASAARLRNLLVHRYWSISDERVYESVKKGLGDFEDFIAQVRSFLRR
ncbi:MAG: DUF86 domain-containing protein [Candidatus Korarchaeum sp.]